MDRTIEDGVVAGAVAAVIGGLPSTVWALVSGDDPLEPTLAAASILLPREKGRGRLLAAAVPVHLTFSLGWALVLARLLRRGREATLGAVAGLGIAALDLGVAGRLFPRVRALPLAPQVADHVAYGATVGWMLRRRRSP